MRVGLVRSITFTALLVVAALISSRPLAGQASKSRPVIAGCPSVSAKFHPCALVKAKEFSPPRMPDARRTCRAFGTRRWRWVFRISRIFQVTRPLADSVPR